MEVVGIWASQPVIPLPPTQIKEVLWPVLVRGGDERHYERTTVKQNVLQLPPVCSTVHYIVH